MAGRLRLVSSLLLITSMVTGQNNRCPVQCRSCDNGRVMCSQAGLTSVPKSLPDDSVTIDLMQNRITSLKGLPPLPNVMSIKLAGNKISAIEGKLFMNTPQLLSLDLSMNHIRKVYKLGFKGLDNVMTISLNGNSITSIGKVFMHTPALTTLRLSFNKIKEIEEDTFENNKMLKMLDLSNNAISKIHPNAFAKLDMLRMLLLSNNPLGTLPEMKFSTSILTLADFTNCELTAVPKKMPASLKDFRLGNNRITKIYADDFKNNTELTLLTLNDNQISDIEHRSFYYLEKLMELWLSRNQMVYIPRGLPMHLEKFHIDNNQVVEFEPMLFKPDSMLKVMSLESNKVHKIHRDALKEIKRIETLNVQANQISEIEDSTFVNLENLQSLTLANNPIQNIQTGAFGLLNNLKELSLAYISTDSPNSQETIIKDNLLSNVPNLKSLNLMSSAKLTKDLITVFNENPQPLDKIDIVNLQYNDLQSLPESVKHVFGNAGQFLLDGNIFVCDKRLVWLNKWMKSSAVQFSQFEQPTCHNSGDLDGKQISDLSEDEFIEVSSQNKEDFVRSPQRVQEAPEVREPIQPEPQQPPHPQQPEVQSISGTRKQPAVRQNGASKYDTRGSQPAEGSNLQPQKSNPNQAQSPNRGGSYLGTRVVIKPPKTKKSPAKKVSWSKLTKEEKEARKAARRAKRLQRKEARRRARKNRGNPSRGRKKRRTRKQCSKDENGVIKCERKDRKRCKVQDDGSVKCRKRKGKKRKSKREKNPKSDKTQIQ